ncbi:MAG: TPM domain-containing protein, partial [Bacteroidales bacterium]
MKASEFFSTEQKKQITDAIKEAELNTSGEIRVHIEMDCKEDVLDRAAFMFEKLAMHKTELRNGVLFYLSIKDRKFAILGDAGINAVTP